MDIKNIIEQVRMQAENSEPIGDTLKLALGSHSIFIDGTGTINKVSVDDKEASCTMAMSIDVLRQLKSGDIEPMTAVMNGQIKIEGDMELAMKSQSFLN